MPILIDDDIPMPTENLKRARKRKEESDNVAQSLIDAIRFVIPAQKKNGQRSEQHSYCGQHWMIACNSTMMIAHPIEEDLEACPNTFMLLEALSHVRNELSITQTDMNAICVRSGRYQGNVPCISSGEIPFGAPDALQMEINFQLQQAIINVLPIVDEDTKYPGVLMQAGSVVAVNEGTLIESWHGFNVPRFFIPRATCVALSKSNKHLVGLGWSQNSVTFYFNKGAFIKTMILADNFPVYQHLFKECDPKPIPHDLLYGVKAIKAYNEQGQIFFDGGTIASDYDNENASTYQIEGLPERMGFDAVTLMNLKNVFKLVHFDSDENKAYFFCDKTRGVLMALDLSKAVRYSKTTEIGEVNPDDIPF